MRYNLYNFNGIVRVSRRGSIYSEGHFEFHFRPVLLRMINSGRRPVAPFPRALFQRDARNEAGREKPGEIYSLRAHVHVERMHISLYECQRNQQSPPSHDFEETVRLGSFSLSANLRGWIDGNILMNRDLTSKYIFYYQKRRQLIKKLKD